MNIFARNSRFFFLNILCYYLVPLMVLTGFLFAPDRYYASVEMGEKAWLILLLILFLKPAAQIFPGFSFLAKWMPFRKQFWVAMLWFVIGHGVWTGIDKWIFGIDKFLKILSQPDHYLFWGILAGIIVFFLGITSNFYSMKLLKRNWKRLHMLVYPALLFTALHIYFITGEISSLIIVAIYWVAKLLAYKNIVLYPKQ